MGRGDYRSYYKGNIDKFRGRVEVGEEGCFRLGWGGGMGRKDIQL